MELLTPSQVDSLLACQVNEKLDLLEAEVAKLEQIQLPVTHGYHNGMYVRQLFIPKGTLLTGAVHKEGYIDIMLSGDIIVATQDGTIRLKGWNILDGQAGRKRAGYAIDDTYWVTVHNIAEEDAFDNYMPHMTVPTYKDYELLTARKDYKQLIASIGMTEEQVRQQVEIDDLIELPEEYNNIELATSDIEGTGVFASKEFKVSEVIGPARVNDNRTILGRYVNHSHKPNAEMLLSNGSLVLVANTPIQCGEEITTSYLKTLQNRGVVK